ncbi:MAG: hypothetical protein R3359_02280 [Marinirhabdus sp.]|nr:hypothetical protein [Marinirhabdus sp.]
MKLNHFYEVQSKSLEGEEMLHFKVALHKEHSIFKGHFPDHPVLPGVAMLQMVTDLLEDHLSVTLRLQSVHRAKFVGLVNPNVSNVLQFALLFQREDNRLIVKNSTTFVDQTRVMDCQIHYAIT